MNKKNVVDVTQVPEIAAEGTQSSVLVNAQDVAHLNTLMKFSHELYKSGMFPQLKNSGQVLAVVLAGHEKGYGPMTSLMNIHIVNGRPGYSAQMIATELRKAGVKFKVLETDTKHCKIEFSREGDDPFIYEWNEEDAKRARKLPAKPDSVWSTYPQDMFFARCLTAGARKYAPDAIMGLSLIDEIPEPEETPKPVPSTLKEKLAKKAEAIETESEEVEDELGEGETTAYKPEPQESLIDRIKRLENEKITQPIAPVREEHLGMLDLEKALEEVPKKMLEYSEWLDKQ